MEKKIFWENIEWGALEQFRSALENKFVVQGALMPDAHQWYSLPIWWVVATKWVIVPAWVWYDIGCWVCALNTSFRQDDIEKYREKIFESIYRVLPIWMGGNHKKKQDWNHKNLARTEIIDNLLDKWLKQLGTLWGWNHFIEISYDEEGFVWILAHSGSRWLGHKVATHYMALARKYNIDTESLEKEVDIKYKELKKRDWEKFEEVKWNWVEKNIKKQLKWSNEWHYGLDVNSKEWKDYISDMNFCLEFALESRKRMIYKVYEEISFYVFGARKSYMQWELVNRNHNHATLRNLNWEEVWIHRKWATHAEKGMKWIIPWNMRDGSFVVEGLWNEEGLFSSSHWAWRVMSRSKAKDNIDLKDFEETMKGITAKVEKSTIDESPFAYKDIFDVMNLQSELISVKHYLKPIINIKWSR